MPAATRIRSSPARALHRSSAPGTAAHRRGSVLIVALLVAALLALVLGGYLSLNLGTARLAQRTFDRGAAFHLAEAGLEEGLWTYNRILAEDPRAWEDWQVADGAAWRRFDGFALAAATTGSIKVYAQPISPAPDDRPLLVALASVRSPGGAPVTRMLEVNLRRSSLFSAGLIARESLAFRGRNTTFDSWDSDPDQDPATPPVPYSEDIRTDTGIIATGAAEDKDLILGQARIHGYFITRDLVPSVSTPGFIGPFGVADGSVESSRVGHDYRDDFPAISPPADGTFLAAPGATLGTAGQRTLWRRPALRLSGNQTLTILGEVTLVLTDPVEGLALTGSAAIVIPPGSRLTLYAEGDLSIGGQGILNANASPASLRIWSTAAQRKRPQTITLSGLGVLSASVYAPEAEFRATGNAEFYGSLIALRVTFAGNAAFHHDRALGRLADHAPYRAGAWHITADPVRRAELLRLVDR